MPVTIASMEGFPKFDCARQFLLESGRIKIIFQLLNHGRWLIEILLILIFYSVIVVTRYQINP